MLRACALALGLAVCSGAAAQTVVPPPAKMTVAEGVQLADAAGFRISANGLVNICSTPAKPKVTYSDLNADGQPEAIARDNNPSCYGGTGDWFTVVAKGPDGRWRGIMRNVGTLGFETSRTAGWLDARVTDECPRIWKYAGDGYRRPASCVAEAFTKTAAAGVTAADRTAAMRAAGFVSKRGKWLGGDGECEAAIEPKDVRDLNGDGRQEIVITETGTFCYGNTGQGFYIMERTPAGPWRTFFASQGIPEFQATKGSGGWPDIELGGPGFCFPVVRYNGKDYVKNRNKEYQPGACARR